jgi:hypothetical protein
MNKIVAGILSVACLSLNSGCFSPLPVPASVSAVSGNATPGSSIQGWSLYTWFDQGLYYWSLQARSNASPDLARVRSEAQVGLESLSLRLQNLDRGQAVFWNFQVAMISSTQFTLPPANQQTQICALAAERSLKLKVAEEMQAVAACKQTI